MTGQVIPHVLLEGDPGTTRDLWEQMAIKPSVWSAHPKVSHFRHIQADRGARFLTGIAPRAIYRKLLQSQDDEGETAHFLKLIKDEREARNLKSGQRLRVACVGSHSALTASDVLADMQGHQYYDTESMAFEAGIKTDRTFVGLFGRALSGIKDIELIWLTHAFFHLKPRLRAPRYNALAAQARAHLAGRTRQKVGGIELPRPAYPLIFTRAKGSQTWERYISQGDRTPTTTTLLINRFHEEIPDRKSIEAVLVKVVARHPQLHNRLDPPSIGVDQLKAAHEAKLDAILLDERFGVCKVTDTEIALTTPIYAV